MLVEGDAVFRINVGKQKAEAIKKFPLPTDRRTPTMVLSPDGERVAMEMASDGGFELVCRKPS
jgi:hypothetical protein